MANLIKASAFPSIRSLMEDFWNTDRFFESPFVKQIDVPPVNIRETDKNYQIQLAAPGYGKDDFKVSVEEGVITISAQNKSEEKEEQEGYTRQEFSFSEFTRAFKLPGNVQEDEINAKYAEGLLTIDLKKSEKASVATKTVKVS